MSTIIDLGPATWTTITVIGLPLENLMGVAAYTTMGM